MDIKYRLIGTGDNDHAIATAIETGDYETAEGILSTCDITLVLGDDEFLYAAQGELIGNERFGESEEDSTDIDYHSTDWDDDQELIDSLDIEITIAVGDDMVDIYNAAIDAKEWITAGQMMNDGKIMFVFNDDFQYITKDRATY